MKRKKLTSIALAAALAIGTFGFSVPAKATPAETTTDYVLTIPESLNVTKTGWNATDGITANNSTNNFDTGKKLSVTAASTNNWALKSGENSVGYNLATAETDYSSAADPASWEFSAVDLNEESGKTLPMGIIVDDYSTADAGNYTDTVTFTAKVEDDAWNGNLATLTEDVTVPDGMTLTGTLVSPYKISIAAGATVTLDGVSINADGTMKSTGAQAGIICLGDATIVLAGANTVHGFTKGTGIFVPENCTLTIQGSGSLSATGSAQAAGIGSFGSYPCGNITIEGGDITATGGNFGAGIGSANVKSCGNINITGGTITATGGQCCAAIGCGMGNCGNITITNGVTSVTAIKGSEAPNSIGAAGDSLEYTCETVTIGGVVTGSIAASPYTYPSN